MTSEAKTLPTGASVEAFIAAVENPARRADAATLCALLERVSGEPPVMWGAGIVGFGRYRYRYDSGRTGEMCRIGFSPRKANLVVYIIDGYAGRDALLARLGKHKTGSSCLYLNRLADIDIGVLEEIAAASLAHMRERYPD